MREGERWKGGWEGRREREEGKEVGREKEGRGGKQRKAEREGEGW